MNVCLISGQLESNGLVRGKKTKALVFTVITKQRGNGNGSEEEQELVSYVPCVIFNPPADIEQQLTTAGKGMYVELQGRLNAARHEVNEEPRSNGECVVYTRSLKLSRVS